MYFERDKCRSLSELIHVAILLISVEFDQRQSEQAGGAWNLGRATARHVVERYTGSEVGAHWSLTEV